MQHNLTTKVISVGYEKAAAEIGEYMNRSQILRELIEPSECDNYISTCLQHPTPFVIWNSWTRATNYLFVKHLRSSRTVKSWTEVVERCTTTNAWEEKSKQCMARRNLLHLFRQSVTWSSQCDSNMMKHGPTCFRLKLSSTQTLLHFAHLHSNVAPMHSGTDILARALESTSQCCDFVVDDKDQGPMFSQVLGVRGGRKGPAPGPRSRATN